MALVGQKLVVVASTVCDAVALTLVLVPLHIVGIVVEVGVVDVAVGVALGQGATVEGGVDAKNT